MGLGDVFAWTRLAVDLAIEPIQKIQDRKAYKEHEDWKAAREAEEAPLLSSPEIKSLLWDAAHPPRFWSYLHTDFGKCAGCEADLQSTDLDPDRAYFCSDKCREDCAYIDVSHLIYEFHDAIVIRVPGEPRWLPTGIDEMSLRQK
jgi:hypothetical protein